ncbi:hypothetical protein [Streptomyces sp. Da 82-17]|uniref:hypothetical protein n=1 Tax=Streptomyces sp. Da 82-17 TaxID=3377116 RepID=UPI0038D3D1D2
MITAWSPSGVRRGRPTATARRLLGLGLLLLGLLYMHAASPDSAVAHLAPGGGALTAHAGHAAPGAGGTAATATHPPDEEPADHRDRHGDDSHALHGHGGDGHGDRHAFEECTLGQPSQGPAVGMPCLTPLSWDPPAEPVTPPLVHVHPSAVRGFVAPIPHAAESPVLRI